MPTQKEINAIKDAYNAKQAAAKMPSSDSAASRKPVTEPVPTESKTPVDYQAIAEGANQDVADINKTLGEINTAIEGVNTAGADVAALTGTPWQYVGGDVPRDLKQPSSEMQDAYQRLYNEFNAIGLGALVADAKDLIMKATSPSAIPDALTQTKAYQTRFSANQYRINAGLKALTPAEYLAKEDAYQNLMRNYGLPASYYKPGLYGKQEGFDKLLANDVSAVELEDRLIQAQDRVLKSNPQVLEALKSFYGDSIKNGDILAYSLDPKNALKDIQRKVAAAEIGGAALAQDLTANSSTAEALAAQGITKAQAQQGYVNVAEMAPRGGELAAIYGESPYGQSQAEAEVFGTAGAADAAKKRKKLSQLEQASFSGSSGVGALSRDRQMSGYGYQSGAGAY